LKIALAQINPVIGDLEGNSRKIESNFQKAGDQNVDLVVLPELAITGYPPRDLLDKPDFVSESEKTFQKLLTRLKGPAVLCGHLYQPSVGLGRKLYNSAVLFRNGSILARADKILLPTYDVFDEMRYFRPGKDAVVVEFQGTRLGISICEDAWNFPGFRDQDIHSRNPIEEMVAAGAEWLVNISASPYRLMRWKTRLDLGKHIATTYRKPFLLVNQVGGNDDLLFDGHSFAFSGEGHRIAQGQGFEEDLLVFELDETNEDRVSSLESEEEEIFKALVMGVRDYLFKCGYRKAVVGLSGGIDSAVVAVIAAAALGEENVSGISMPSQYTQSQSVDDAEQLAKNLGTAFHVISIKDLFDEYKNTLDPLFAGKPEDVTEENIQARIRGNILMAYSNKMGNMVLSTGNKSEMSVGYCTLYGDMAGGLSVISDVPKMKVYALARWINRDREIIPHSIIDRPPTAELRPNQRDQDSLPPYEVLDPILEGYVESHLSVDQLVAQGFEESVVRDVVRKVDNNEYKRKQAAPGLKITDKAFGTGRRFPIAQKFRQK